MAIPQHLEVLKQGVEAWNKWRTVNADTEPDLAGCDLSKADLKGANLGETDLRWADLTWADLGGANLNRADLRRANLSGAIFNLANLSEANLSETYLSGADLSEADLKRAIFIRADLASADLSKADCQRADFRWAYLIKAIFNGANLSGANLIEANLTKAELKQSNLEEAFVAWSCFGDNDLGETIGLNAVKHFGPSTIGIDTIYRSKGHIPEEFLRGAGVPEHFISYTGYLNEKAFRHHSCFISFSGNDRSFIEKIGDDLQREGVRCWYAPEEMKMGDAIRQQVDQLIRIQDKLLVVLSKFSVESPWIQKEVAAAIEEERNRKKTILFPLRLDNGRMDTEKDWLKALHKTHPIYDFTAWQKWEAYFTQFSRLVDDIKGA
ncbi:MAG: toll/interleukin-1 receptor domain-containing protein [Deltaproteobacteria bacterium]|nr:toll/interleukin-1 receptor domain-containing protein [Deltaproteobacteria bacterium]